MKSILVLGNARSGTSMTSGMLSILGVDFHETKNKQKVPSQNPKGSFENENFISITSKMHQDHTSGKNLEYIKNKYASDFEKMIKKHEKDLWGFKSALTHHFLPIITPLMKNTHIIVVLRNLLHNSKSWIKHMKDVYGKDVKLDHALEVMYKSQNVLMKNSLDSKCPVMFTSYEDIKLNPWSEAKRMAKFINVEPRPNRFAINKFIMPEYSTISSS